MRVFVLTMLLKHNVGALVCGAQVMTCGRGSFGRQNNADMRTMNKPVYVKFDGGHWKGVSVSAGGRHSIAVMELMKRRSSIASFGRLNEVYVLCSLTRNGQRKHWPAP
jgi:hypothetical protein